MLSNSREDSYSSPSYILHIIHNSKSLPHTSSKYPCQAMSTLLYGCSCYGHWLSQLLSLPSHHMDLPTPPYHNLQHLINPLTNSIPHLKIQQQELTTCPALAVVRLLDVKLEKERWWGIIRDWYAQGLADTLSTGKLHHHLRLLGWEKDGEDLLFTNIQLNNFTETLACFLEREHKWIMMGAINLGVILEWASGMICQSGGLGTREGPNLDGTGV